MKPVGLINPKTGHRPWAEVQLRRENREGTLYNLVGFQTNLKFGEQKRVFSMIPGFAACRIYALRCDAPQHILNAPQVLNQEFQFQTKSQLYSLQDKLQG